MLSCFTSPVWGWIKDDYTMIRGRYSYQIPAIFCVYQDILVFTRIPNLVLTQFAISKTTSQMYMWMVFPLKPPFWGEVQLLCLMTPEGKRNAYLIHRPSPPSPRHQGTFDPGCWHGLLMQFGNSPPPRLPSWATSLNQKPDFLGPQNEIEFRFNLPLSLYILVKLDYLSIFLGAAINWWSYVQFKQKTIPLGSHCPSFVISQDPTCLFHQVWKTANINFDFADLRMRIFARCRNPTSPSIPWVTATHLLSWVVPPGHRK